MSDVDPFVIRWPDAWLTDPEVGPVVQYLNRFLHDIWVRTGGGTDALATITNSETYETSMAAGQFIALHEDSEQLESEIYAAPQPASHEEAEYTDNRRYRSVKTSVNYTAVDHDFVEGNNGVTIKADPHPGADDVIVIANGDGSTIRFDANGNNIMYTTLDTCMDLQRQGTTITFQWFDDGPYWRPR